MWSEKQGTRNGWYTTVEEFNRAAIAYQSGKMGIGTVVQAARRYWDFLGRIEGLDRLRHDEVTTSLIRHERNRVTPYLVEAFTNR